MPPAGFELAMPTSEWPQTYSFDRAAAGIGTFTFGWPEIIAVVTAASEVKQCHSAEHLLQNCHSQPR